MSFLENLLSFFVQVIVFGIELIFAISGAFIISISCINSFICQIRLYISDNSFLI